MTTYTVREVFWTLQGEGANAGRPAVFVRFAGCNMWSGREEDRAKGPGPCSRWCDTDFVGGDKLSAEDLLARIDAAWGDFQHGRGFVVLTGGEPALQITPELIDMIDGKFDIAVETNGSRLLPAASMPYWVTVSPKGPVAELIVDKGDELKLIFPTLDPAQFEHLDFDHFYLQPLDDGDRRKNALAAVEYIRKRPRWRLSLQTHKEIGIP